MRQNAWGKGYATEAVSAILEYAFATGFVSRINRIQALTIPGNVASEKVLLKLGFTHEGLLRQYGFWKDVYHDMNCYSLLAGEHVSS